MATNSPSATTENDVSAKVSSPKKLQSALLLRTALVIIFFVICCVVDIFLLDINPAVQSTELFCQIKGSSNGSNITVCS